MDFLTNLLPHLINGVSLGLLFALIALGFMLIVGVMETINLAHGSLFALGMYVALFIIAPKFGAQRDSEIPERLTIRGKFAAHDKRAAHSAPRKVDNRDLVIRWNQNPAPGTSRLELQFSFERKTIP